MSQIDLTNLTLNDINVDSVTNTAKTGVFDKLLSAVNDNINEQFLEGRINNTDYASIYLGSLQAILSQSVQFALQEQMSEVQVATAIADNNLKLKQLDLATLDIALKQYELDNIVPEQYIKIQEEIDILQTQDSEMLLNGVKDRLLKDADVSMKAKQEELVDSQIIGSGFDNILKSEQATMSTYERTTVQPKQLEKLEEEIDLLQSQDLDMAVKIDIAIAESAKSVLLKQEQIESEALNNGADGVIANQILDIKKGVDVKERQMSEAESTATKQRLIMDEELETADLQQIILATEEELKTAQKLETEAATTRSDSQLSDSILTSTKQRILLDEEIESADLQQIILATEEEFKTAQLAEVTAATIRSDTQLSDSILTSTKQRILLDEEIESADLQQIILATEEELKTAQKLEIEAATVRADTQLGDSILTSTKQRILLDEEVESADLQQSILTIEATLKKAQKDEITASTIRSDTQLSDSILTSTKQRKVLDEELESADLQQSILAVEEEIKTAQKLETVDSTLRANTQLDDALATSDEQRKVLYADRVIKDKQSAKLGLDNIMRISETSRDADPAFVYTPQYEDTTGA